MAKIAKNVEQINAFKEIENDLKVLIRLDGVIEGASSGFQASFSATDSTGKSLRYATPVSESVFKSFLRQQAKALVTSLQGKASKYSITLDDSESELCKKYAK